MPCDRRGGGDATGDLPVASFRTMRGRWDAVETLPVSGSERLDHLGGAECRDLLGVVSQAG